MAGIDLNKELLPLYASLRFFGKGEHHITRLCPDNVLLLVYSGALRFSEDGVMREVRAGEYYIQRKNSYQSGEAVSDEPQYLYVHFNGEWTSSESSLEQRGEFNYPLLEELIKRTDAVFHSNAPLCYKQHVFLELILSLKAKPEPNGLASQISKYIEENLSSVSSLSDLCAVFHYSKNYIIRVFKSEYGMSPFEFINEMRINKAMRMLESTSLPIDNISTQCGYESYSHFYRLFVKRNHMSPYKWRKAIRHDPLFE